MDPTHRARPRSLRSGRPSGGLRLRGAFVAEAAAGGGAYLGLDRWMSWMRASHSRATVLDGARVRPERVARRIPEGRTPDLLTFAIMANFQLL
ncbi:hypothetical protein EVAR_72844_1, partial [Eumeta japonica]